MDRQKANRVLGVHGSGRMKTKNSNKIVLPARQTEEDIIKLEQSTDEELMERWKSLVSINIIYDGTTLNELQQIELIELEIDSREQISMDELNDWYEKEKEAFNHKNIF
jgi:hypothetical protein